MNIFVTDNSPITSARNLPDKHICKMPLETCQMLAIIYSDWYYGVGKLYKADGNPYRTAQGAFRNHPCTQWAAANQYNLAWLIRHGYALCDEYMARYNKLHACQDVIQQAERIYHRSFDDLLSHASSKVTDFTRAMQSTSSMIRLSLLYKHTSNISTPSRGCLATTYAYHHASHHSLCDALIL